MRLLIFKENVTNDLWWSLCRCIHVCECVWVTIFCFVWFSIKQIEGLFGWKGQNTQRVKIVKQIIKNKRNKTLCPCGMDLLTCECLSAMSSNNVTVLQLNVIIIYSTTICNNKNNNNNNKTDDFSFSLKRLKGEKISICVCTNKKEDLYMCVCMWEVRWSEVYGVGETIHNLILAVQPNKKFNSLD